MHSSAASSMHSSANLDLHMVHDIKTKENFGGLNRKLCFTKIKI